MIKRLLNLLVLSFSIFGVAAQETTANINEARQANGTGHFVYASAGYAYILSKVDADWTSGDPKSGFNIQAGYEWISKKRIGVGLLYNGYFTSGHIKVYSSPIRESIKIHYIGPQFAGRVMLKEDKWTISYKVGLGLIILADKAKGYGENYDYGFGSNLYFGVEYQLFKNLGVIGAISSVGGYIGQSYFGFSENSGISKYDLSVGLQYHF